MKLPRKIKKALKAFDFEFHPYQDYEGGWDSSEEFIKFNNAKLNTKNKRRIWICVNKFYKDLGYSTKVGRGSKFGGYITDYFFDCIFEPCTIMPWYWRRLKYTDRKQYHKLLKDKLEYLGKYACRNDLLRFGSIFRNSR